MKYKAGSRRRASEYEKAILEWWKKDKTFSKSVEMRPAHESYVFYDGPPFITGMPHHGTLLSSIVKDAVPRFWTMKGKRVERRWGWDCHGLPAENFVEKQLGIKDRREIGTSISLENYINTARKSMVANSETWEGTIERVGRWVEFRGAYRTMDREYMESVWWAFKTLYEKGKIYEGRKVLMYDTKFATPVSKAEVTMDNDAYQNVTDPSAYVKFRTTDGKFLIAWTTTPWTLPANMALAVNPEMEYGEYKIGEEIWILATSRAGKFLPSVSSEYVEIQPERTFSGKELVGVHYEQIFREKSGKSGDFYAKFDKGQTFSVLAGKFVSDEDGTGIVHIAPAYGEDDYALCLDNDVDFLDCVDENGYYEPEMVEILHELGVRNTDESGIQIWDGNKFIAKVLEEQGIICKIEYIQHEYPFNPRSKQRIMYRAFPSWFFDIQGSKELMLSENENVNWFPAYLKNGRFQKNIEAAPDWNLSRDRFWATAMPVWKDEDGDVVVMGSYEELKDYSGVELEDYHRPWVDEIEFDAYVVMLSNGKKFVRPLTDDEAKGVYEKWQEIKTALEVPRGVAAAEIKHFARIPKVLDCWFESGSMPFAQLHYPFENKEKFESNYPADFIVEYVGQVRAWFYYLHAVNTALFGKNPFSNVITTGTLAGNDGRKMSKSLGNYTDPNELMDKYSADALRFLLLSSPVLAGEDFALLDKDVSDVARKLSMVWNVYDFFCTYAEVDGFDSNEIREIKSAGELYNSLDKWIVSRIWELRDEITEGMTEYNLPKALSGVIPFIDDLSNWFVRRSRRRFSKSTNEDDKMEAYRTLGYVMTYLAELLAPFTPFLAEELYQKMTGETEKSVHLLDWPEVGEKDSEVLNEMARVRGIITDGLALRMRKSETEEQIKVRQPLAKLVYAGEKLSEEYEQIIAEEVNVKVVESGEELWLDKAISEELRKEGYYRELVRGIQSARKKMGLSFDDKIRLSLSVEVDAEYVEMMKNEVLALEITLNQNYEYDEIVKVDGENVTVSIDRVSTFL